MKTPEEWRSELDLPNFQEVTRFPWERWIRQIQLDAWRKGMADAAAVIMAGRFLHDEAPTKLFATEAASAIDRKRDDRIPPF